VVGVLTQPDRPAGRGQNPQSSAVKHAALARGLEVAQPLELKTAEGRAALAAWQPDFLVVVAYGLILPQAALDLPRRGCLNIHASLLPRWRGAAPIQRAIQAGDRETGVTIMRMEAGLDTGPVYLERRVPITSETDAIALHDTLAQLGARAVCETLEAIVAGTLEPRPQAASGVCYAAKISKAEARIDWTRAAAEIDAQVRAFVPWPVAETRFRGEQLRIHRARLDRSPGQAGVSGVPGDLHYSEERGLRVRCGEGALELLELQREGRRRTSAAEFGRNLQTAAGRFE